ncbi:MAG: exodeoxyribonuclease VII large subunit [Lachnospiraceae bacterium]|nr:exodeoxyribonuclease VII large subunit [Lachnospiraceae bacterium]
MRLSVYTVGQVNSYIKNMFMEDFLLRHISIKGEVSNCKYHSSGHIYFSLKDKDGVIACVMFKGNRKGLEFKMQEGQMVVATGTVGVYERDGRYQLYAEKITLDGAGDLYKKFEELKQELEEMGMFAPEYKKSIPEYALNIGIVTSGTGAAIQDIINITKRRNPYVQLHLYPALVQGAMAAPDIVNGIRCLDSMDMDVIIVGRGGGSIEDLWAFNEEIVARAVFDCETPVISAVGHETDTTIVDFVADRRAPTPSAAAELAVFDYERFVQDLNDKQYILARSLKRQVLNSRNMVEQYRLRLINKSPQNKLMQNRQYINDIQSRMSDMVHERINSKRNRLSVISERLNGLSPLNKLSKGFAYVQDNKGMPLVDIGQIKTGDRIKLHLKNGSALADITNINKL